MGYENPLHGLDGKGEKITADEKEYVKEPLKDAPGASFGKFPTTSQWRLRHSDEDDPEQPSLTMEGPDWTAATARDRMTEVEQPDTGYTPAQTLRAAAVRLAADLLVEVEAFKGLASTTSRTDEILRVAAFIIGDEQPVVGRSTPPVAEAPPWLVDKVRRRPDDLAFEPDA